MEVWDPDTCRLRKDLPYQAREELMMHDAAVLALAFSRDGEMLATGDTDGAVKVPGGEQGGRWGGEGDRGVPRWPEKRSLVSIEELEQARGAA